MTRIEVAADQLRFAHAYTHTLIDDLPDEQWYQMPAAGVTHIGWQVAHIAYAEHVLVLGRVLGCSPEESGLLPDGFVALFGKGSQPTGDASRYPSAAQVREIYEGVHTRALDEIAELDDRLLDEISEPRHPAFRDKFGALLWSARHELVHAGQIALLRRELGHAPLR